MADLFVSQDGPEIRVCKRDEDGRERVIAYIGSPEGVESPDDWAERADEVLAEWLHYARLFAQAEKMKEALEQAKGAIRMAISYTDRDQPRKRRQLAQGLGVVRKALAELEEGT